MTTAFAPTTYMVNGWAAGVDDSFGVRWHLGSSTSHDGPGVKMRTSERPYASGSYRVNSHRAARTITLQGAAECPDRQSAVAARLRLLSIFPSGRQQRLVIDDGIGPRQCLVELADTVKIAWVGSAAFEWQMALFAADPRLYELEPLTATTTLPAAAIGLDWTGGGAGGLDWSSGGGLDWGSIVSNGTVTLSNAGIASTWPTITLQGPLVQPTVSDFTGGRFMAYDGTLSAGDSLVITCSPFARSVLLNGSADRFASMRLANWFSIPAQGSITLTLGGSGAGSLSASWYPAHW